MKRLILLFICYLFLAALQGQNLSPDDTEGALSLLTEQRLEIRKENGPRSATRIAEMLKLGMWEDLEKELKKKNLSGEVLLQKAQFLLLKNRFKEAGKE